MISNSRFARGFATAGLAFAASCAADAATAPSDAPDASAESSAASLDLNTAIDRAWVGGLNKFGSTAQLLILPVSDVPFFYASTCPYTPADQSFTCPTRTASGLTFALKFFLYDAGGHTLSAVNPAATASVRTVTDVTGTIAPAPTRQPATTGFTQSVVHHGDMTLSGLLTPTPTLNGTSRDHDVTVIGGSGSSIVTDLTGTTTNVVLHSGAGNVVLPVSGTIVNAGTQTMSLGPGSPFGPTTQSVSAVVTFNPTSMTIVAKLGSLTISCQVTTSGAATASCG